MTPGWQGVSAPLSRLSLLSSEQHQDCGMDLRDFQQLIERMYSHKDRERGSAGTFLWLMEEVGELAAAVADGRDRENLREEFADVLAWLATLANVEGVDLSEALRVKYGQGCPGCGKMVCTCQEKR
ncbi:MAG: nucleotide pyrophosphohydrolase [Phycisphaerae bacterium]|nr:nucleotide pyrophosphohydrolase [Phycisphaerae bacterium]